MQTKEGGGAVTALYYVFYMVSSNTTSREGIFINVLSC